MPARMQRIRILALLFPAAVLLSAPAAAQGCNAEPVAVDDQPSCP